MSAVIDYLNMLEDYLNIAVDRCFSWTGWGAENSALTFIVILNLFIVAFLTLKFLMALCITDRITIGNHGKARTSHYVFSWLLFLLILIDGVLVLWRWVVAFTKGYVDYGVVANYGKYSWKTYYETYQWAGSLLIFLLFLFGFILSKKADLFYNEKLLKLEPLFSLMVLIKCAWYQYDFLYYKESNLISGHYYQRMSMNELAFYGLFMVFFFFLFIGIAWIKASFGAGTRRRITSEEISKAPATPPARPIGTPLPSTPAYGAKISKLGEGTKGGAEEEGEEGPSTPIAPPSGKIPAGGPPGGMAGATSPASKPSSPPMSPDDKQRRIKKLQDEVDQAARETNAAYSQLQRHEISPDDYRDAYNKYLTMKKHHEDEIRQLKGG